MLILVFVSIYSIHDFIDLNVLYATGSMYCQMRGDFCSLCECCDWRLCMVSNGVVMLGRSPARAVTIRAKLREAAEFGEGGPDAQRCARTIYTSIDLSKTGALAEIDSQ